MALGDFPAAGYLEAAGRTNGEMKDALEDWLAATKEGLGGNNVTGSYTLDGAGVLDVLDGGTTYAPIIEVNANAGVADTLTDLDNSDQIEDGRMLILIAATGDTITVDDSAATELVLKNDNFDLVDSPRSWLLLEKRSTAGHQFFEIARGVPGLIGESVEFTSDDTWDVPNDVWKVLVYAVGGGGGGGGGAGDDNGGGAPTDGAAGNNGAATYLKRGAVNLVTAAGGAGGLGGLKTGQGKGDGHNEYAGVGGEGALIERGGGGSKGYGGGGGNGGNGGAKGGGGGGCGVPGAIKFEAVDVVPGETLTIDIGAKGTGGAGGAGENNGGDAGNDGTDGYLAIFY